MGEAELQSGNDSTATDYFNRALAVEPGNRKLLEKVSRLHAENVGRSNIQEEQASQRDRIAIEIRGAATPPEPRPQALSRTEMLNLPLGVFAINQPGQ